MPRSASQDEIQRAYRKLARTYHPDVNSDPGAKDRFKETSEAYDVLSDPETRRRYDDFGPDFRQVPPDMDAETWARVTPAREPPQAAPGRADSGRAGSDKAGSGRAIWAASISRISWADCSAAGLRPDPRRGPGDRARADRGGGLAGWPPVGHPGGPRRPADARRQDPGWGDQRAAHPPGRPGRPRQRGRPQRGSVFRGAGSPRTPGTASTAATSTSTSRSRRGKPRWAHRRPWKPPAAR